MEIATFCTTTYGVSFPMTEKLEVNGPGRHRLYAALTDVADAEGNAGDIQWNFEKFVVAPGLSPVSSCGFARPNAGRLSRMGGGEGRDRAH